MFASAHSLISQALQSELETLRLAAATQSPQQNGPVGNEDQVVHTCTHVLILMHVHVHVHTCNFSEVPFRADVRDECQQHNPKKLAASHSTWVYLTCRCTCGVYVSQLVRIGRICSNYTQFARRHYKLTQCLIHQGFRYSALCIAFRKFAKKYTQVLEKYGCSIRKHIEDGVCLPAMDPFLSRHVSRRSF